MKPLGLNSSSTSLSLKNYLNISPCKKIHGKGIGALACSISVPLTLQGGWSSLCGFEAPFNEQHSQTQPTVFPKSKMSN